MRLKQQVLALIVLVLTAYLETASKTSIIAAQLKGVLSRHFGEAVEDQSGETVTVTCDGRSAIVNTANLVTDMLLLWLNH